MTTVFAEDLGDDGDEGATIVIPRPALGLAPIHPPSDPPDHGPTLPDASCAPDAEELPPPGLADGPTAEDEHRATVPTGPPVEHVEQPRDVQPWWRRWGGYVVQPFVWLFRAVMEPPSPSPSPLHLPPPPPVASARGTLLSAGEEGDADRGERLLDALFLLSPAYLGAAELVARYARALHRDGPHAVLMGRVHLALSRLRAQRGVRVVSLRSLHERLCDVAPRRLDRALLDLEAEGVLELLPPSVGTEVGGPVLLDELRGALARIDVLRTL